ncbi:hypothetical protein AAG906_025100 [Vitis piasezkii]
MVDVKEEEVFAVVDGVAGTKAEEKTLKAPTREKAYLVVVECKGDMEYSFGIEESLKELAQLADTAGLMVVGSTSQKLSAPNPRTYIGSGKVAEIKSAIHALDVETVTFDDEFSAGQLRDLEKAFGGDVRVCDRPVLILDIFNQRAATHEAALQVTLAQMEYPSPRLTKMGTHLERQAGGKVKGMELESVRQHRKQYRNRRFSVPVPVSTLLNRLTGSNVLAEDRLFATLDPTTRRVQEFLLIDTVGFIQKLPNMLLAILKNQIGSREREDVVCISALNGDGLNEFCNAVQEKLKEQSRNLKAVELDVDRFIKDMELIMRRPVHENVTVDVDSEGGSSSDMDFDEFEHDNINVAEPYGDKRCVKAWCCCSGHAP